MNDIRGRGLTTINRLRSSILWKADCTILSTDTTALLLRLPSRPRASSLHLAVRTLKYECDGNSRQKRDANEASSL